MRDIMTDALTRLIENDTVLIAGAGILVLLLAFATWGIRRYTMAHKAADVLGNVTMVVGLLWSSESMIEIGYNDLGLPIPLIGLLFFIFEMALLLSMLRAKESVKDRGKPGTSGNTAWGIALVMGVVAAFSGSTATECLLRLVIPLVVTKLWWDGLVGPSDEADDGGAFNWTPRKILIRLGAITPGKKDVKTVHREQLTQRMTDLYYASLYGPEKKRSKVKSRLARLTLDADDEIIRTVLARVGRTSWVEAKPLPYALTQPSADGVAQGLAHPVAQEIAQPCAPRKAAVEVAPARRAKAGAQAATSDYADGEDAGTRAARYVLAHHPEVSNRQAAEKFGVSDGTVRNRIKDLRKLPEFAHLAQSLAQQPTNGHQFTGADN